LSCAPVSPASASCPRTAARISAAVANTSPRGRSRPVELLGAYVVVELDDRLARGDRCKVSSVTSQRSRSGRSTFT
jgi:hypothetical protein